jgi:hypothetical protein
VDEPVPIRFHRESVVEDILLRERANETVAKFVDATDYRVVLDDLKDQFPEAFDASTIAELGMEPELYLKAKLADNEITRVNLNLNLNLKLN